MRSPSAATGPQTAPPSERKLHFPTAINRNDFATIAILRTIYTLTGNGQSMATFSGHESHVLPLSFNETLKSIWASNLAGGGRPSTIKYTYGVEFSGCGNYALYHDIMGMSVLPKRKDCRLATTLAMFTIRGSDPEQQTRTKPQIRLLGTVAGGTDCQYFEGWSFHPTLPVLAVQSRSLVGMVSQNFMLWNFSCGMQ